MIANVVAITTGPVDVIPSYSRKNDFVSLDVLNKFRTKKSNSTVVVSSKKGKKKKIKLNVSKITANGEMDIDFNQKVNVPYNFIKSDNSTTARLLGKGKGIMFDQLDPKAMFNTYVIKKS